MGAILPIWNLLYETVGTLCWWLLNNWFFRRFFHARDEQLRWWNCSRRLRSGSSLTATSHFKRSKPAWLLLWRISHFETSKRALAISKLLLIFLVFGCTHAEAAESPTILFNRLIFLLLRRLGNLGLLLLLSIFHSLHLLFIVNFERRFGHFSSNRLVIFRSLNNHVTV